MISSSLRNLIGQGLVILLITQGFLGGYSEIHYFNKEFWLQLLEYPDFFGFLNLLQLLLRIISYTLIVIGSVQLVVNQKIALLKVFKFPLFYSVASSLFWWVTVMFSTEYGFISQNYEVDFLYYVFKILQIGIVIAAIIYFLSAPKLTESKEHKPVSKFSRFVNWLLDLILVSIISLSNVNLLSQGFIFEDIPFLNEDPSWFVSLNLIIYYLFFEVVFLQTVGKLHNNSFVAYKDNRFSRIIGRTLCRLIPFEAFSFLGKKGWHDSLSGTQVVVALPENK
jgi:hypothetical protein